MGSIFFVILAVVIGKKYLTFLFSKNLQRKSIYYLVGMIFAFVVSILVNCCFENRILFDRQNPFGLLFWLYLGIGCTLINSYIKGEIDGKENIYIMKTIKKLNLENTKERYSDFQERI